MLLMLAITGCGRWDPELTVDSVEPSAFRVGETLIVRGSGFDEETRVALEGETTVSIEVVLEADALSGTVPVTSSGTYDLVVTRGDRVVRRSVAVRAGPEVPCARAYTANTQFSVPDGLAVIDRFHGDGRRDRVEVRVADIANLRLVDSANCSAIFLDQNDGSTLLFEDSSEGSLSERAVRLSAFMKRELRTE